MTNQEKNILRRKEYPEMARDALPIIENLIINRNKLDLAMDFISEFVFRERKDQMLKYPASKSNIEEFQLVLVLCDVFAKPSPDVTRNALFLSLFPVNPSPQRASILNKLVSTAISAIGLSPILCAAGAWVQQAGATSEASLELAKSIVMDFVIFANKPSEQLKSLPMIAPRFAANFMTAVCDLYLNGQGRENPPPNILLEVITEWVSDNHSLCLASQQSLALPSGAITMPVTTPIAGLIRWCVLSVFYNGCDQLMYSKLNLAILETLQENVPALNAPSTALNAQHLGLLINLIQMDVDSSIKKGNSVNEATLNTCLERFAQAVQVALTSRSIFGNIPQLICRLETLPYNKLLQIVIKANKII